MKNVKKIIIIVLIAICLMASLCACDFRENPCTKINVLLALDYSKVDLNITTKLDGTTLKSFFTMRKNDDGRTIQYSIQRFGTFEITPEGEIIPPEDEIVTSRGSVVLKNGNVVEQNGDVVDVEFANLSATRFDFNPSYFTSMTEGANFLIAEVSNPQAFMENDSLECTNMKVNVNYGNSLEFMTITYTSANGAEVELKFSFTL